MEATLLIKVITGLVVILFILIFLFILPAGKKKPEPKKVAPVKKADNGPRTDMASLRAIIRNRRTTAKGLQDALDLVIKHHGKITKKLGSRMHPDFDEYMEILFTICRHPNTTKDIILNFNRELERLNPSYKQEINDAVKKGLDSR